MDRPVQANRLRYGWIVGVSVVCGWLDANAVAAEKIVTVRSVVEPAYAARRASQSPPPVETYVFARGQCFDPIPMDSTLARMSFRTIAATLAADLKPRGFEPAPSFPKADLVVVVHWGVTMENPNPAALLLDDHDVLRQASNALGEAFQASDDPGTRNGGGNLEAAAQTLRAVGEAQIALRHETSVAALSGERNGAHGRSNAELLGIQSSLVDGEKLPFGSAISEALQAIVNEERYFIIVIAYDAAELRAGRKRRMWTTRASLHAAGVNFADALGRLSGAAAGFHGSPQSDLVLERSTGRPHHVQAGHVEIGEFKVLGESASDGPRR